MKISKVSKSERKSLRPHKLNNVKPKTKPVGSINKDHPSFWKTRTVKHNIVIDETMQIIIIAIRTS